MGTVLLVSAVVMLVLGFTLATVVSQRIAQTKIDAASAEIDRARVVVQEAIDTSSPNSSLQARLNSARASLTQRTQQGSDAANVYEPVLLVQSSLGVTTSSPESYRVPEQLVEYVTQGNVAYQFAVVQRPDGAPYNALIIGTPTGSDVPNLQLYLVTNMDNEASTLALMRGLLASAALIVIVLLVGIAWLASQQIVAPVRSASRTAERFAAHVVATPEDAAAAVAGLDPNHPTWLRAEWADPVVMTGAEAMPFPILSRRDAQMAPVVVATSGSPIADVANARSFGAAVTVVDDPDPRESDQTLFAMAGLAELPLVALGRQFGTSEDLASRIMQAEEYYSAETRVTGAQGG